MSPVITKTPGRLPTLAALAKTPIDDLTILGFKGSQAGVEHLALGHKDEVKTRCELVAPENLSNQPFRSVPHDRTPQFSCRGHAKATDRERVGQNEQRAVSSVDADAALIDPLEFGATPDTFIAPEPRQIAAYSLLTVRRFRPLARRRLRTRRPFLVAILTRKP